jgi:hypothetical protein
MNAHHEKAEKIRNGSEWRRLRHFVQNVYADGFGNWHAQVLQGEGRDGIKSRRAAYLAILLELLEREQCAPNYRIPLAYVPQFSTPTLATYGEKKAS